MKKGFYIVIAALLVLSLTACGKSKSTNSVPLVDCSDRGSAVEGGCYLMTEETPDEICEEAKVIYFLGESVAVGFRVRGRRGRICAWDSVPYASSPRQY